MLSFPLWMTVEVAKAATQLAEIAKYVFIITLPCSVTSLYNSAPAEKLTSFRDRSHITPATS